MKKNDENDRLIFEEFCSDISNADENSNVECIVITDKDIEIPEKADVVITANDLNLSETDNMDSPEEHSPNNVLVFGKNDFESATNQGVFNLTVSDFRTKSTWQKMLRHFRLQKQRIRQFIRRQATVLYVCTVIILMVSSYLAYVIPFGTDVKKLNSKFAFASDTLQEASSSLAQTTSPDTFLKYLKKLSNLAVDEEDISSQYDKINKKNNILRSLWARLNFGQSDVNSLRAKMAETVIEARNSSVRIVKVLDSHRAEQLERIERQMKNVSSVKEAVAIINTHIGTLRTADSILLTITSLGTDEDLSKSVRSKLICDINYMRSTLTMISNLVREQKKANGLVNRAIGTIKLANNYLNNLGQYARSSNIKITLQYYQTVSSNLRSARNVLTSYPNGLSQPQKKMWDNLNIRALSNVNQIINKLASHINNVEQQYAQVKREEATLGGSMKRGAGRLFEKFTGKLRQASQTKMGREIGVGVKTLLLGTKMLYDLQNPDKDLVTWALSYEDEVNKLMREVETVGKMKGASITDINVFMNPMMEKLVNEAYKASDDN